MGLLQTLSVTFLVTVQSLGVRNMLSFALPPCPPAKGIPVTLTQCVGQVTSFQDARRASTFNSNIFVNTNTLWILKATLCLGNRLGEAVKLDGCQHPFLEIMTERRVFALTAHFGTVVSEATSSAADGTEVFALPRQRYGNVRAERKANPIFNLIMEVMMPLMSFTAAVIQPFTQSCRYRRSRLLKKRKQSNTGRGGNGWATVELP